MSEDESDKMSKLDLALKIFDRYGLATMGLIAVAWFAWAAIEYEREQMRPCIEMNTKAIERNSEVIRQLPAALRKEINVDKPHESP